MPTVVTGSEGNLGSNASGVGAVMFDRTVDPLEAHYKNLEIINDAIKQKQVLNLAKQKQLNDMASALNPDFNGIRPFDEDALKKQGQGVQDALTNFYKAGGDLSTPQGQYFNSILRQSKNDLDARLALSKDANSKLSSVYNAYANDKEGKYDKEAGASWYAEQMGKPLDKVSQINYADGIKLAVPDIVGATAKAVNAMKDIDVNAKRVMLQTGETATQTTTTKDPIGLATLGVGIYNDPRNSKALTNYYNILPLADQTQYTAKAALETLQNQANGIDKKGDPLKYAAIDLPLRLGGGQQLKLTDVKEDPLAVSKFNWEKQKSAYDDQWQGYYRLMQGDDSAFENTDQNSTIKQADDNDKTKMQGEWTVGATKYSALGDGEYIGKFDGGTITTKQAGEDANGNPVFNTVTTKAGPVNNLHYLTKKLNGKVYVMNTESLYNAAEKKGIPYGQPGALMEDLINDPNAWQPASPDYVKRFTNGVDATERKLKHESFQDFHKKMQSVSNGLIDPNKAAGINQQPTTTQPAGKTGKYFTPGGKTEVDVLGFTQEQIQKAIDKGLIIQK